MGDTDTLVCKRPFLPLTPSFPSAGKDNVLGWMTSSSHLCDLIPEQHIQPNDLRCFCYLYSLFHSESRRERWNFLRTNSALTTFPSKHSCSTDVCRETSTHPKFLILLKWFTKLLKWINC